MASGIIPTSVGSGTTDGASSRLTWDHPHERGERDHATVDRGDGTGSSPRAWGAVLLGNPLARAERIIPTSVGSGGRPPRSTCRSRDHPHERGERPGADGVVPVPVGSSPRAWGAAGRHAGPDDRRRIIPTSVGSGPRSRRPRGPSGDHPHERGERADQMKEGNAVTGSSPRAWGADGGGRRPADAVGIIPTSVGSGGTRGATGPPSLDHPHERGERRFLARKAAEVLGSSPRAWGAAVCVTCQSRDVRIIPTSVGSGHPSPARARALRGSSPRAWGAGLLAQVVGSYWGSSVGDGWKLPVFVG